MKKVKLIYNPLAGDTSFKNKLDAVLKIFQKNKYMVVPYRISNMNLLDEAFYDIDEDYDLVAISGGDGTINAVIGIMAAMKLNMPIGLFPFGTANDFATHLGISKNIEKCCDIILKGHTKKVDIGRVNNEYFINVCSAGLLAEVSYKIDTNLKNTLGIIAYYIKGIEEIPKFAPIKMRMEYDNNIIEDNFLLFLVLNGSSAGGFTKLAPNALINDGKLDVLAIKYGNISNMLGLFLKILRGDHIGDSILYHFQTDHIRISSENNIETDIDGERGPGLPLDIEVQKKFLEIFVP